RRTAVVRPQPGELQRSRHSVAGSAQRHEPRSHAGRSVPERHESKKSQRNRRHCHDYPTVQHRPPRLTPTAGGGRGGGNLTLEHGQQVSLQSVTDQGFFESESSFLETYKVRRPVRVEVDCALEAHAL